MNEERDKQIVKIETESGEVTLSPNIVRRYLVNGNGSVSDQEVMMFLALCKYQKLNPFLREAYLVKYGTQQATIITGKEAFLKRAMTVKDCDGFKAGVVIQKGDELLHTDGVVPPDCKLVGGWAEVYKKNWSFPLRVEVSFNEYVGRKGDGSINSMWTAKPATMIRKVALVQALREAFPVDLAGMYSPEEINTVQNDLPHTPVDITVDVTPKESHEDKSKRTRRTKAEIEAEREAMSAKIIDNAAHQAEATQPGLETTQRANYDQGPKVTCPKTGDPTNLTFCDSGECPDRNGCPEVGGTEPGSDG